MKQGESLFSDHYPFVSFGVLNIEEAPETEEFAAHSIDMMIGTNVLHATQDIGRTLKHVKGLLKPGGMLLLNELTSFSIFTSAVFGLLDGWWLAQDKEKRMTNGPLLSPKQWEKALKSAGFSQVGLLPGLAVPQEGCAQTIIVAQ